MSLINCIKNLFLSELQRRAENRRILSQHPPIPSGIEILIQLDCAKLLTFLKEEYLEAVLFNISFFVGALLFLRAYNQSELNPSPIQKYWLRLGLFIVLISTIPKIILLVKLFKIKTQWIVQIRNDLRNIFRSRIFYYNSKISFVTYFYFIFGITKLINNYICNAANEKLFSLSVFMIVCFLIRIGNLVLRYLFQFYIPRLVWDVDTNLGASNDEINEIHYEIISNLEEIKHKMIICLICHEEFKEGDTIRLLPCNEKHFFHMNCIDSWLFRKASCPICNKNLQKKQSEIK